MFAQALDDRYCSDDIGFNFVGLERLHCLVLGEKYLARQLLQKVTAAQPIHDNPFHFTQVQGYALLSQSMIDGFEYLQSTQVDRVYGGAHKYHVL